MATRKTTTKAKTKTTKKPAAKARTAAAKTTRATKSAKVTKPTTKKPAAVKAATTAKSKVAILSLASLRKLNFVKAFVFTALAVTAGVLMNQATYAITLGYQGKDALLNLTAEKTAFVHASQAVADVQIRWILVIILGLAALFSLLAATTRRPKYESEVTSGVSTGRWVGLGITSALMVETIALLSGVSDIFVLKLIAGLMLATCALGWVADKRLKQAGRPVWSEFTVSLFTGLLPWLLIGAYAVSTWAYGLVRYPWFVYALFASTLIGFIMLAGNQYKRLSGWKNNLVVERNYLLIGLVTKAAFAVILILGFQK